MVIQNLYNYQSRLVVSKPVCVEYEQQCNGYIYANLFGNIAV